MKKLFGSFLFLLSLILVLPVFASADPLEEE